MSDAKETGRVDRTGEAGAGTADAAEANGAIPAGRDDAEVSDLSNTGVGLGAGEPNTFEPEEAGPAADSPSR